VCLSLATVKKKLLIIQQKLKYFYINEKQ
jgi:hypothetical protein